jgi:MFS family permease
MSSSVDLNASKARQALLGAWAGFFVDLFDIYLPILVLAPAMGYFLSTDELSPTALALIGGMIFAVTLIGRPIGAFIFGHIADRTGRKRATIIALGGVGVTTILIAVLPGYQQIGVLAVVLLILLRLLGGIFLGGEYTGANPLAMELAPKEKRGVYGAIINSGFPLAYAFISILTLILLTTVPANGVQSGYVQWAWRIPFVLGGVFAILLAFYYRRSVSESKLLEGPEVEESAPIRSLFQGKNLRSFLQVFVLVSGFWLSLQPIAAVLPGLLGKGHLGFSQQEVTLMLAVAYLIFAVTSIGAGALSQRIGRRTFFVVWGPIIAVVGGGIYWALMYFRPSNVLLVGVALTVLLIAVYSPWACLPSYICERFQTGVRASGYGLGYSLAVVLPSFYAFYQAGLSVVMPNVYTGVVLLAVGAVLITVGALMGPETKDVDFAPTPTRERAPFLTSGN